MMLLRSKSRLRSSLFVVVTIAVTMDINYAFFSLMDRYLIGKSNHRPLYSLYGIYYSHDHFLVTLTQRQEQRERKKNILKVTYAGWRVA